jgi:hypothetical protein
MPHGFTCRAEGYEFAVLSSFQAEDKLPKEISVEMHM